MDERRRHVRFKSATIIQFKNSVFSADMESLTKDVSLGGICFFSQKPFKVGQTLKVKLFYDIKAPGKVMTGRVAWCKETKDEAGKGYLNGLTFVR